MGWTLDHRPGHTITWGERRASPQRLGVGIARLSLGAALQDRKILPVAGGPCCLRRLRGESRRALQAHPAVRASAAV